MFALSKNHVRLSPSVMKFADWWIYDLKTLHPFWKEKISQDQHYFSAELLWEAILKAYRLHSFTPLKEIGILASTYHSFFKTKISSKNQKDVFAILRRLGLDRLGNLKRLPLSDIQKRFGKSWKDFFHGFIDPASAPWKWIPYREKEIFSLDYEFENLCADLEQLLQPVENYLKDLAHQQPQLQIENIHLQFTTYQSSDDPFLNLTTPYPYILHRDLKWILKLLHERLSQLSFRSPVTRLKLDLHKSDSAPFIQLSIFSNEMTMSLEWKALCEKLLNENFKIFVPEILPSYLPEDSWRKGSPFIYPSIPSYGLFRPLIQETPSPIANPLEKQTWFTERLTWFDTQGEIHGRDYFISRGSRQWLWVFKNEKNEWFQQGVIE
jgi:hypothetical protein